ncbi:MAG: NERD domain-containing protein, partial [Crocinitomicaceae bacterium]
MIYPEFFPADRHDEKAEHKVFEQLKKVSDKYDIFYSRTFVNDGVGKKPEYEIDFIVAIPEQAIVCIEVKGGLIRYNGISDQWTQNGRLMSKSPDRQATSSSHALAKSFSETIGNLPVGWALSFPDCQIEHGKDLPTSIAQEQILDDLQLLYINDSLPVLFDFLKKQFPTRNGVRRWQYEKFKSKLLRNLGFVQMLSTKIKYDAQRFTELTAHQMDLFSRIASNKDIITLGPAGSGKTIVAKTIAQDLVNDGKRVLFLCFNRTLANKVRYEFDRYEDLIEVTTFHSLSRRIIDQFDATWWTDNKNNEAEEFWNLDVPAKLEECLPFIEEKYDALIIDEGQDFKEFWFELLFQMIHATGRRLIFMDKMQNIFGHFTNIPNQHDFVEYTLPENCRNTKNIVKYLSTLIDEEISSFDKSPSGEEIVQKEFKNNTEQQKYILDEIKSLVNTQDIKTHQILILLNSAKAESSLA